MPPFTVYLITSPTTASVGTEILAVVLALSLSLLFSALFSLPSFGFTSSTNVISGSDGAVVSVYIVLPAVPSPLPVLPALSVTSTVTLSPVFTGLVVSITNLPSLSVLPSPITLPSLSFTITGAFGSSDLPVTVALFGLPSAGLFVSTGVTLTFSTLGAFVSTSKLSFASLPTLPA